MLASLTDYQLLLLVVAGWSTVCGSNEIETFRHCQCAENARFDIMRNTSCIRSNATLILCIIVFGTILLLSSPYLAFHSLPMATSGSVGQTQNETQQQPTRFVMVSDTHGLHNKPDVFQVPDGMSIHDDLWD